MSTPQQVPRLNANSLEKDDNPTGQCIPRGAFVIGTDTDVGKTFQACQLARTLVERGLKVGVYKPVASGGLPLSVPKGSAPAGQLSDAELLQIASQTGESLSRICPQSFAAPLAPPVAARLEGKCIDQPMLLEGALWWRGRCDFLIVEGAGGALSPISDSMLVLDLVEQLQLPILLIAANRVGVINHTLLTVEAIQHRKLDLLGIVLNRLPQLCVASQARQVASSQEDMDDIACRTNHELLQRLVQVPVVADITLIPRLCLGAAGG